MPITFAPALLASWTAIEPTPPAAADTATVSPGFLAFLDDADDGVAGLSRYLTFHHKSVDPRAIAQVPATPALFSPDYFGSYIPSPRKARDRWTEPESRRLREVWLYRQWRLTHVAMRRAARHCQRCKAIQSRGGYNQWIASQASADASSRSEPAVIMSEGSRSQKAGARSLAF
jgi:hypothetical protein